MKALDRIRTAKNGWDYMMLALELVNYFEEDRLRKAMQNYVDHPRPLKVKSERGRPVR